MANITHKVWDFLQKSPAIEKNLSEDIINVRALADYIIKTENLEASMHSVISAIRRYVSVQKKSQDKNKLSNILKNSMVSTKSRLVSITISRDFSFLSKLMPSIYLSVDVNKGDILRVVEGRESMKLFFNQAKKNQILKMIPHDRLFSMREKIGEINIHLDDSKGDTPGLVSIILNELAANDINIVEIIGCMPEVIIFVEEKDISKTHDIFLRFFYGSS